MTATVSAVPELGKSQERRGPVDGTDVGDGQNLVMGLRNLGEVRSSFYGTGTS